MASLRAFGAYLPSRIATNQELASRVNCTPEWILDVSGIEERRYAAPEESVEDMAVAAAQQCLDRAGMNALKAALAELLPAVRLPSP